MASFTALNVEPESDFEEEVDDSKEIQVEEAVKLYQRALKLHAQGPDFYDEAEDAYDALFASEIFKYPEALSEAKRLAKLKELEDSDEDDLDLDPAPPAGTEAAPNSLPQVLYLSYKNHGEFLVDRLAHQIYLERKRNPNFILEYDQDARESAKEGLDYFAEALDRDETDAELWRRTSRVARLLGSRRISRFCLEAALSIEGPETTALTDATDLEGLFAKAELGSLLEEVDDFLYFRPSMRKGLSASLKKLMDPFPRLPPPLSGVIPSYLPKEGQIKAISAPERSWASIGRVLLLRKKVELKDDRLPFGQGYRISVPSMRRLTIESSTPKRLVTAESLSKRRSTLDLTSPEKEQLVEDSMMLDQDIAVESPVLEKTSVAIENNLTPLQMPNEDAKASELDESAIISPSARRESSSRPHLKRNSESAGIGETPDGARARSKRLRSRADPTPAVEEDMDPKLLQRQYEEQLEPHVRGDEWLFNVGDRISSTLGVQNFKSMPQLRSILWPNEEEAVVENDERLTNAIVDLKTSLNTWDGNKSNLLLHGSGSGAVVTLIDSSDDSGLASFLEHSKPANKKLQERDFLLTQGLDEFIDTINEDWRDLDDISTLWIERLLKPWVNEEGGFESTYTHNVWPTLLKETVSQFLIDEDGFLYPTYEKIASSIDSRIFGDNTAVRPEEIQFMDMIQAFFELHVDIYGKMTNASSKVDQPTRTQQRDRMLRWSTLASQAVGKFASLDDDTIIPHDLGLRHLWCTVIYVSLLDTGSREHVLLCLRDLKNVLEERGFDVVSLPNNSIMPEISPSAAEREIARLTTMDFFLQIFDPDSEDPLAVIESLEPILMAEIPARVLQDSFESEEEALTDESVRNAPAGSQQKHMSEFLAKASASLRLSLWHRLKTAYEKIDYPPMVLVCNLRSVAIILAELSGQIYTKDSVDDRSANLMVWIRNLSDLLTSCLDIIRSKINAMDCMDEKNLSSALGSVADATKLFHVFSVWEDSVRIGQSQLPVQASGAVVSHRSAMNFLRDMQPKCWMLQYFLFKEATSQNQNLFPTAKEDLAEFLMSVHNSFGRREYCKVGKKSFLKLMKSELISLKPAGDWEVEMAQLLYDLYGMKICPSNVVLEEHGCTGEPIDRSSALEIIEPLMIQAMKMNIKDVLRSDIKTACEKMQAVIGQPRANSTHQSFNRRLILALLKSPVLPMNLYRSLKGVGGLSGMPVRTEFAPVAKKHWFFLQGHLLLARYRSQKRTAPDTSGDLDEAVTFFKLDLDFDSDRWETWYRLAQTYDAKIEEDVTWNSDKINEPKSDIVALQRSAIHCYSMALAIAIRTADESFENVSKLSELYTDFGNRIYASTREPFSMKVFSLVEFDRFSNSDTKGTFKRDPLGEMKEKSAWYFASVLYGHALVEKPDYWVNWYMLGKCLWKLYRHDSKGSKEKQNEVINCFVKAVECVPEKKDNKHPDKDPVLEPHYKLVATIHKLVHNSRLSPSEGATYLSATPHSQKATYTEADGWEKYILKVVRTLRSVDKANWHHRMVARAAHIQYDDRPNDKSAAEAAKQELGQQIFTKTMAVQVWRPENERAGRHFVYTTRYTRFFISLLDQLADKASIEALCKRIRRKQGEFVDHIQVWTELCVAYAKLIRVEGKIPEAHEDSIFKYNMPYEQFALNAQRLEQWGHSQLSVGHPTMDKLREIIELKKLNGNYMKPAIIDDLVGDTYARIYEEIVPGLMAKAGEEQNRDRMRIDRMLMNDSPAPESAPQSDQPTAATSSRPKSIGKTEVRKRAEALVSKLMAPSKHWRTKAAEEAKEAAAAAAESARTGPPQSSGGSVHDSADDESELSDVPDDIDDADKPKMFPGLVKRSANEDGEGNEGTELEADGEGGDDGDVEGNGDEEGDVDVSMGEGEEYDTAQEGLDNEGDGDKEDA